LAALIAHAVARDVNILDMRVDALEHLGPVFRDPVLADVEPLDVGQRAALA